MSPVIIVITVIAVILLVLHWKGPNAVWGAATLGVIVGLIVALVTGDWGLLALIFAVGTFIGTFFEWVGRLRKSKKGLTLLLYSPPSPLKERGIKGVR